jgi:hypothetical protein
VITLSSGGRIEADEVWRTKDGVWYRRNGIVTLVKRRPGQINLDPLSHKKVQKVKSMSNNLLCSFVPKSFVPFVAESLSGRCVW